MTDQEQYDKAKQTVERIEREGIKSWATSIGYRMNIATMNRLGPKLGYGVYNDIRNRKPNKQTEVMTFKKSDIINQEILNKDIEETFERLKNNPKNFKRRTEQEVYEDTVLGLTLEHYLIQNDPKFKKATDLNPTDFYHDLIDTTTNEIHECKVTRSYQGWDSFYVQNRIKRILNEGWNHSKYMHVATYSKKTEVYTYLGIKQIR